MLNKGVKKIESLCNQNHTDWEIIFIKNLANSLSLCWYFIDVLIGWNVDFDLPDVEGSTNNTELTTITASLPTTVTSSSVTTSQPTTSVFVPSSARTNKVRNILALHSIKFI